VPPTIAEIVSPVRDPGVVKIPGPSATPVTLATVVRMSHLPPKSASDAQTGADTGETFSSVGVSPENTNEGLCLAIHPCLLIVLICAFQLAIWPSVKPDDEPEGASYASA
jgi:hypothetical protein